MAVDDVATDPECPPTFNIQDEVIGFHVSFTSRDTRESRP